MNIEDKGGLAPMKASAEAVAPAPRGHHGGGPRRGEDVPLGRTARSGKFGRMFPHLMPLVADQAALEELGNAMLDNGGSADNATIPAGFTYLGQFLDHDITFDPTALQEVLVDPQALENFRTPLLDLDSVYGAGPAAQPGLYQRSDKDLFEIGVAHDSPGGSSGQPNIPDLPNDLPRGPQGFAIIGDPRNDENLVVAQLHLAFLKFHNKMVAGLRDGSIVRSSPLRKSDFEEARDLVIWHYQRMVIDDFLSRICDAEVLQGVMDAPWFPTCCESPFIPVEFSAAAYRFGHSMVREEYNYNRVFSTDPGSFVPASLGLLFQFSGLSGDGSTVPIPSNWVADWRRFFDFGGGTPAVNASRLIDPFLAKMLHTLPGGGGSLPERNLLRGRSLGLPTGQSIARFFGYESLKPTDFTGPDGDVARRHQFDLESPLWYYILKEAQVQHGGQRLGKVGSRIVAEVFLAIMRADTSSFYMRRGSWEFEPVIPHATAGKFTMVDLLNFVGELNPIG